MTTNISPLGPSPVQIQQTSRSLQAPNDLRAVMAAARIIELGPKDLYSRIIQRGIGVLSFDYLDGNDINTASKVNVASHRLTKNNQTQIRENLFKNRLMTRLLPGITIEQLPLSLISYNNPKTGKIAWEKSYNDISKLVYGPAFLKSIGVRAGFAPNIPQTLLEKKYLPTHSVKVAADSTLGLTESGDLTNDPQQHAPVGHRYHRNLQTVTGVRTVEFPNTESNRNFIDADPSLKEAIAPYPMQSPLEQGSPLIAFQTNLEIDVPAGSPLRSIEGVLTEEPGPTDPAVNGKRTVKFLNTPHNWLILAQPDPTGVATKYLNEKAKPVKEDYISDSIKSVWDIPAPPGWEAPSSKLVGLGATYLQSEVEATSLGLHPLTFQQSSIHRILAQIGEHLDLYPGQFSRTSTDVTTIWGSSKAGTYVYPAVGPAASARVDLHYFRIANGIVGLAAAWGPAGSL